MTALLKGVVTRFRAYQLDRAGSSYSYFADGKFTLIEAMATESSTPTLLAELAACGKMYLDTLHITSWDSDHCNEQSLDWILRNLQPGKVEYPGYEPHTDCARACQALIRGYHGKPTPSGSSSRIQRIDPAYINSLGWAEQLGYRDIFYHPRQVVEKSNDNSTIKFFRTGMFNVLSLGDVESTNIGSMLRMCKTLCAETDVMILAHHGSANGVTTKPFLERIRPSVAVCTSNYGNQYEHPSKEVSNLLHDMQIRKFTTKTGDVLIQSIAPHFSHFRVSNLITNSTQLSSEYDLRSKKHRLLAGHRDSVVNHYRPGFRGLRHK
jgi:competence protein ComEC